MSSAETEFHFGEMAVGLLQRAPAAPGRYRYIAYRGPGHYDMQTALKADGIARCHCLGADGRRVEFDVVECSAAGELSIKTIVVAPVDRAR